ncbi:probable RNA-binding protein EIF1AD [Dioscorea cayenensis subsp. rotundata]|uniref:Probable RNA-binding protein EIF1AD n=1 Tax=Dioscorea cayennensis subsp. rotundata TaxID=55577 RepID=A0AB40D0S5_DIOCR|nr:probable RNA-binding protein EIF1AD [Dioscorea cayenensis subsp. rotundata]
MKAGRKNLKKAVEEDGLALQEGQSIMQVVSLRGSNLIEVMDAKGVKSLALFPAKFQKSFWIKRGSYVVVDDSGREKALESGSKIACVVSQVLFHEQVRALEKSSQWPTIFQTKTANECKDLPEPSRSEIDHELSSDDEDGLPPLEANLNRNNPLELYSDSDSCVDSDGS